MDERGRRRGRPAGRGRGQRRRHAERCRARRAARLLLERLRLRRRQARAVRRVGLARPARRVRAHEAARRGGRRRAGVDRPLLVALRADRPQLRAHDAAPGRRARRGGGRGRPARLPDLRRVISRRRCRRSSSCRSASTTWPREGDCTWADFAEAIFAEAGLDCRVRRIDSAEFGARAPRPAYSVLRSEKGAPELPHWRDGLRECLAGSAESPRLRRRTGHRRTRRGELASDEGSIDLVGETIFETCRPTTRDFHTTGTGHDSSRRLRPRRRSTQLRRAR